tara:strand:+ start:3125 stop:3451 length:327 start_codon:yes stop_codon:yes gene_type:complete
MTTVRPWRQEIELIQNYPKHHTFTVSTTNELAKEVVDISSVMEECNKISFIVETADAYIAFDKTATTDDMLIPANEGYFDDSVFIGSSISIIRAGGTNARIRGILWGR